MGKFYQIELVCADGLEWSLLKPLLEKAGLNMSFYGITGQFNQKGCTNSEDSLPMNGLSLRMITL